MKISPNIKKCLPLQFEITSELPHRHLIFKKLYDSLQRCKKKIDKYESNWNRMKRFTNPYELIYNFINNNNIAKHRPISRSYFKMIEIMKDYNINVDKDDAVIASLAEAPGGFIEAMCEKTNNKIYGISLEDKSNDIPRWKLPMFDNVRLISGNLYLPEDVMNYVSIFKNKKAYLVTADGGFDCSDDYIAQEMNSYRIIYAEIITAIMIQEEGGVFVCKFFDLLTKMSLKLIYILYCLYDNVYITKLKTSRPCNSEKYLIAKGFKGANDFLLNELFSVLKRWDNTCDIVNIEMPNDFVTDMFNYNKEYVNTQKYFINKTITNNRFYYGKNQSYNAIKWCKEYNVEMNTESKYYNVK